MIVRTISPTLSTLTDKDTAKSVAESAAFIGLSLRARNARTAGRPLSLTKAEAAFLRDYMANGTDPLAAIRTAELTLQPTSDQARVSHIDLAGPRIDVPKIKSGAIGADGRPLAVVVPRETPDALKAGLLVQRQEHAAGAKALALLDTLSALRCAWDAARASAIAFAAVEPEKAKQPGKRLENHAAALLTADPHKVAQLFKAMGLPDTAIGAILATMAARQTPAPVATPAIA